MPLDGTHFVSVLPMQTRPSEVIHDFLAAPFPERDMDDLLRPLIDEHVLCEAKVRRMFIEGGHEFGAAGPRARQGKDNKAVLHKSTLKLFLEYVDVAERGPLLARRATAFPRCHHKIGIDKSEHQGPSIPMSILINR
jgi:hypothetical protein